MSIHNMLSASLDIPELQLGDTEAHELASTYAEVCKHYPKMALPPDMAAIMAFGSAISITYGSRIAAYRMRKAFERNSARQNSEAMQRGAVMPTPPAPANGHAPSPEEKPKMTQEMRQSTIPGVGTVEFPPDHPMFGGGGRKVN